jgi:hypothetical protein
VSTAEVVVTLITGWMLGAMFRVAQQIWDERPAVIWDDVTLSWRAARSMPKDRQSSLLTHVEPRPSVQKVVQMPAHSQVRHPAAV